MRSKSIKTRDTFSSIVSRILHQSWRDRALWIRIDLGSWKMGYFNFLAKVWAEICLPRCPKTRGFAQNKSHDREFGKVFLDISVNPWPILKILVPLDCKFYIDIPDEVKFYSTWPTSREVDSKDSWTDLLKGCVQIEYRNRDFHFHPHRPGWRESSENGPKLTQNLQNSPIMRKYMTEL